MRMKKRSYGWKTVKLIRGQRQSQKGRRPMKRLLTFAATIAAATFSVDGFAADERPVEIPLKHIWALDMPRTRNVRDLEKVPPNLSNEELYKQSLVEQIQRPLRKIRSEAAGQGFVVLGTGVQALKGARDVFTNTREPPAAIPKGEELSIFFYSYLSGAYVHLDSVYREHGRITIRWRFITHMTLDTTAHFALIPIGKLSAGKHQVDIVQLPLQMQDRGARSQPIEKKEVNRIVCHSFSFRVK
jgi:hypothetical protein